MSRTGIICVLVGWFLVVFQLVEPLDGSSNFSVYPETNHGLLVSVEVAVDFGLKNHSTTGTRMEIDPSKAGLGSSVGEDKPVREKESVFETRTGRLTPLPVETCTDCHNPETHLASIMLLVMAGLIIMVLLGVIMLLRHRIRTQNSPKNFDPENMLMEDVSTSSQDDTITMTVFKDTAPVASSDIVGVEMIDEILGRGEFAIIRKGCITVSGGAALNIVFKTALDFERSAVKTSILSELTTMRSLPKNRHVLPVFGFATSQIGVHLVLPFAQHGDLLSFIRRSGGHFSTSSRNTLHLFSTQIAAGLQHLHQNKCIHLDLACRNVLLSDDFTVMISDFGLSEFVCQAEEKISTTKALPVRWTAPETLYDGVASLKSDIWSFGITLFEIYSGGAFPYAQIKDDQEVIEFVASGGRLSKPDACSQEIFSQMELCFENNPKDRPTSGELAIFFERILYTLEQP